MMPQYNTKEFRDKIDAWTAAGIKIDKRVTQKLDELEKFEYIDTRPPALPANLDDPEKAITDFAVAIAVDERKSMHAPSFAEIAKTRICNALALEGLSLLSSGLDDALEQLRPRFGGAASDYVAAVTELPEDFGANYLVAEGEVFDTYSRARAASAQLRGFDSFVQSLSPFGITPQFRITTPQSVADYRQMLLSEDEQDGAVTALNSIWFTAARLGVPFEMNTPERAEEIRALVAFEYSEGRSLKK